MIKQYYVPNPEDIHIYSEYQHTTLENNKEYIQINIPEELTFCLERLRDKRVEIKFLDKEDIEDLGWKLINEDCLYKFQIYNYMLVVDFYNEDDFFPTNPITITEIKDNLTVFYGKIKNKQDLKKLMKQLEIQ